MIVSESVKWSRVAAYVGRPIAVHVLVALGVAVLHARGMLAGLSVPALPVTILASTIGILLAFRNNSGYDRWWEARTLWGGIVNESRTFARRVLTFLPAGRHVDAPRPSAAVVGAVATDGAVRDRAGRAGVDYERRATGGGAGRREADLAARAARAARAPLAASAGGRRGSDGFDEPSDDARELVYAQIALVNAMRCHLRRQDPLPEIAPFLQPEVLDELRSEQNIPTALLTWMAHRLRVLLSGRDPGDVHRLIALEETLGALTNLLGGCERIKNTPIPRQYDWLPRVVARAYLLLLPTAVVAELGYFTPFVTAVIAFLFLSMDAIGRNVEAPFENGAHDTPMTALSRTIEINLRQMLGETELPPPVQPVDEVLY